MSCQGKMSLFQGGAIMRMSYADGLTSPEIEIAEGGQMLDNKSKFADLRAMLDSNKESVKMDAMKRIISMVAKGKDVSELFAAVVKNVAVKNLELKKLVYVYLVRYAEEQQDLALLSVSTFQKALQDPNQLIRASALRVLSSIRVPMITTVMLLALKASVRDMSAYVRKVAAHAIPKLYSLNPDLLPELLDCIDYLLGDKRTLVLGSAVYAFEETCPDRLDLLHKHFRALCRALADVDEWGQVVMIGLLTRYARTQFIAPAEDQAPLDPDHALLILSARPLLQSRNCSVVMSVAQLLYYIAPPSQLSVVPRALVRLLRAPNEVQYVVLVNIATICATQKNMVDEHIFAISKNLFEPFLKSFFVRGSDTKHVKQLKLQILTSLVTETNVQLVVRELQAYLHMPDLASSAIEAIGRCALQVSASSDSCLSCLVNLVASPKESIVCSAVVVLKRLLHADAPIPLLKRVIKLIHTVKAPSARACVIWLVTTHIDKVPKLAPDLLRVLVKNFCEEDELVKLQTLNLAVKLWIKDREKCEKLIKYVILLARYDRSYDIRDRCRFLRNIILKDNCGFPLDIFMSEKPAPTIQNQYSDRENFQLGTLSHLLNQKCNGYTELPDFPEEAPDPTVRRNAMPLGVDEVGQDALKSGGQDLDEFYSDESGEEGEDEEEEEGDENEDEEEEEDEEEVEEEEEEEEPSEEEEESEESSSEEEQKPVKKSAPVPVKKQPQPPPKKQQDLLVDLDFSDVAVGAFSNFLRTSAQFVDPRFNSLLKTDSVQVDFRFTREPSFFSNSMTAIEFRVSHKLPEEVEIVLESVPGGPSTSGIVRISELKSHEFRQMIAGIDFGDQVLVSNWTVSVNDEKKGTFSISPKLGELLEGIELSKKQFDDEKKKLVGAYEHTKKIEVEDLSTEKIYKLANCKSVLCGDFTFAAQTVSKKEITLISFIPKQGNEYELEVNSADVRFGVQFLKELSEELSK
ncbi:hypothetical protein FO519_004369 [Halicephalobus sp. NKZ332]|nr:hypothetical protein FO519_004369 [Halicephalobus sp. NKZ332]